MSTLNNDIQPTMTNKGPAIPLGLSILVVCFVSLFVSPYAMATSLQVNSTSQVTSENPTISREKAISIAKQGQDSRVLKVKKQQRSSGSVYKIKLLTDEGRVKQVVVNASTGQIEHKQ